MITVQSKNLAETLMFMLNKDTNEFSEEELSKIKTLVINAEDIWGEIENDTDFEVLKYLNNLEELVLDSVEVDEEVFEYVLMLKKLKRIIFNACNIISEYKIEELPVKKIEFISTSLMDWGILIAMPNLKEVVFTVPIYEHNLDVVKKLEDHNVKVKKYDLFNQ